MRFVKYATIHRHSGLNLALKTRNGLTVIGNMVFNPSLARHEIELPEEVAAKYGEEIGTMGMRGLPIKFVGIREEAELAKEPDPFEEQEDSRIPATADGLMPVDKDTRFHRLVMIAKDEGVDISQCKTNAERALAINDARALQPA